MIYIKLTHWSMKKWQPLADDIFKYIILNEVVKKSPKVLSNDTLNDD